MSRFAPSLGILAALSIAATVSAPSPAHACGGGSFYSVSSSENVSTTGHRVVLSLSKAQTVLWDQIEFAGSPKDFAWIYPVKTGAKIEIASDAWTEAVDFKTTKFVQSPTVECDDGSSADSGGGSGCSSGCAPGGALKDGGGLRSAGGDQSPPVDVIHSETIGPYDTVTIKSDVPGAISAWLTANGYKIPADVAPILDDYAAKGFDFIALRLTPGAGVEQMKPVRVITPGASTTFPMRMLSAGAGDKVALNVMVLTEGRVKVEGFSNVEIAESDLSWDFAADTSNYKALRDAALATDGGAVFLTSYALKGQVFGKPQLGEGIDTVAGQYYKGAETYGDGKGCDYNLIDELTDSSDNADPKNGYLVVDVCDDMGVCAAPGPNEIDSRDFECGEAKDLAIAVTGMHPRDIWITRLEANLPKAALDKDLTLTPVAVFNEVPGSVQAQKSTGDACSGAGAPLSGDPSRPKPPLSPEALGMMGAGLALALMMGRRRFAARSPRWTT